MPSGCAMPPVDGSQRSRRLIDGFEGADEACAFDQFLHETWRAAVDGIDWNRVIGKMVGGGAAVVVIYIAYLVVRSFISTAKKGLDATTHAARKLKDRSYGIPDSGKKFDELYSVAFEELKSGNVDNATWAKAFAHCNGDEDKTRAHYIKYRVQRLKEE